jgi:hypothetical protein
MKRFKILIVFLSLCLIIVLNIKSTYSYFTSLSNTETVSFALGNVGIRTNDTSENKWRYVPIDCENSNYDKNDLVNEEKLLSDLKVDNLRPGDAFERVITITNTGTLTSKIKVSKSDFISNSVYSFSISAADEALKNRLVVAEDNSYILEKVKPGEDFKIKLRLEVPTSITYKLIEKNKLQTNIPNTAIEMFNIIATQYSNPNWNE